MADNLVPHFHNTGGEPSIDIGVREFKCIGAEPPFDQPHVFLDMGEETEIICPYCSTHYRFTADLKPNQTRPHGYLLAQAIG